MPTSVRMLDYLLPFRGCQGCGLSAENVRQRRAGYLNPSDEKSGALFRLMSGLDKI